MCRAGAEERLVISINRHRHRVGRKWSTTANYTMPQGGRNGLAEEERNEWRAGKDAVSKRSSDERPRKHKTRTEGTTKCAFEGSLWVLRRLKA